MVTIVEKSPHNWEHISINSQEELNKELGRNFFAHSVGPLRNLTSLISRASERLGLHPQTPKKAEKEEDISSDK